MSHITIAFNDEGQPTVPVIDDMLDWDTAIAHEGANIPAQDWSLLGQALKDSLKSHYPDMTLHDGLFTDFDLLLGVVRNLNVVYIVAHDIALAHIIAHETGDADRLDAIRDNIEKRIAWAEKNGVDTVAHNPLHMIANCMDVDLEKKLEVVENQRGPAQAGKPIAPPIP